MQESVLLGTKPLVDSIHTPLHPGPEWRIFRMSPLWVSYRSMASRYSRLLLLLNWFLGSRLFSLHIIKKKITWWLEDMNFMFSWQEQYLRVSAANEWDIVLATQSNTKFISSRHRVISSIHFTLKEFSTMPGLSTLKKASSEASSYI